MTCTNARFIRRCAAALSGLALGWLAGPAWAQQPAPQHLGQYGHGGHVVVQPNNGGCYGKPDCCPQTACCEDSCHGGGIMAGAAFYYVKPVWTANPAFVTTPIDAATPAIQTDFDYDYTFSPAIWVGFGSDKGLGGRIRWFRFDQNESLSGINDGSLFVLSATPLGLANASDTLGDELLFGSGLKIETWDFEITNSCCGDHWTILASGGVRYAHVRQRYLTLEIPEEDPGLIDLVASEHDFNGLGPTASIEARRKIGVGLAVYANARGSLLWGDGGQDVFEILNGDEDNPNLATTSRDIFVSVGELEVGGEFSRERNGRRAFVRAGFVAQGWFGIGNSANVGDLGALPGTLDNRSDLGLVGLTVAAGVSY
jgi:hypothetical protein